MAFHFVHTIPMWQRDERPCRIPKIFAVAYARVNGGEYGPLAGRATSLFQPLTTPSLQQAVCRLINPATSFDAGKLTL